MMMPELQTVKPDFLNHTNKETGFIVWSRPGNGSVTHIQNVLHSPEYHVTRLASHLIDMLDVMPLPVLGEKGEVSYVLPNYMEAARQARDINGKKLVFIFDDISSATHPAVEAFTNGVINRKLMGVDLNEGDFVLGAGMLDPKGNPFLGNIPRTLYTQLDHYVIDFGRVAA